MSLNLSEACFLNKNEKVSNSSAWLKDVIAHSALNLMGQIEREMDE